MLRLLPLLLACLLLAACAAPAAEPASTPAATPAVAPATATPDEAPPAASPAPTAVTFPTKGYCNGEGVNLRAQASTDSRIVDILGENTALNVVHAEGEWYRVNADGLAGYISRDLVSLGEPPRNDNMRWGRVIPDTLPLYISPDDASHSDVTLEKDAVVRILRELDGHLHIVYRLGEEVGQRFCPVDALLPIPAEEAAAVWFAA